MLKVGLDPSKKKTRNPETIRAFLELHIEQGPILEEKGIQIGIVEGIVGLTQLEVTVQGQAGHDAMVLSDFTACGMVFVPSKDGLSHCPEEWSDASDLAAATDILFETVKRLTKVES